VGRLLAGHARSHSITKRAQIEIPEEVLTRTEHHRTDREMHVVDCASAQILTDRLGTAADAHISAARGGLGPFERFLDATGDEVKRRSARHLERLARMMSEHEDGHMVRRLVTPPTAPGFIQPRSADRPEHVPTQDPRAGVHGALMSKVVVDADPAAARVTEHALERARRIEPLVQLFATFTERILFALVRTSAEAVYRNGKTIYTYLAHGVSLWLEFDCATNQRDSDRRSAAIFSERAPNATNAWADEAPLRAIRGLISS